jgi:predicted dehydrogenase
MRTPLDLAIIGCGAVIERLYLGALTKLGSGGIARVAALIDPNPKRTTELGRHFRSAIAFAAPGEAFAHLTPDLVIVASPPARHAENTITALAAGSHVLCEKPMAVTSSDAARMADAARAHRRVLGIGMTRRMHPALADARALIAAGALGDDVRFTYREGFVYSWPVSTDAPFRRATAGGGVLTDLGSHVLDLLSALFGSPTVVGYEDDAQGEGVEANCRIELSFPRASGTAQLSWSQPLATGLHAVGTSGELTLRPGPLESVRWRRHGGAWETVHGTVTWPSDLRANGARGAPRSDFDCMYYQLVQVLRGVANGEPVPVTGEDALPVVRAIETCYEQATPLRLPWLTPAEQAELDARHWSRSRCAAA